MGDRGVLVSSSISVDGDQLRFAVRSHPHAVDPFVVLELGNHQVSMHVFDVATLTALAQAVAEARDLLSAALAGQTPLPVETSPAGQTLVSA